MLCTEGHINYEYLVQQEKINHVALNASLGESWFWWFELKEMHSPTAAEFMKDMICTAFQQQQKLT